MLQFGNVVRLSLDSSITPEAANQRKSDILTLENPLKKLGALALHNLVMSRPAIAERLADRELRRAGLTRIGSGFESVVYKHGNNVMKVLWRSIDMEETQRQQLANKKEYEHKSLINYMGDTAIGHDIIVDTHPIQPNGRAVQIHQPFYNFTPLNFFNRDQPSVNVEELDTMCRQYPGLDSSLADLVVAGNTMFADTGLIPDTNGSNNFGIWENSDGPNLILIDSQPISNEHAGVQITIKGQLDALKAGLSAMAA